MIVENKKYKNDENESPNDDSIEETIQNAGGNNIIENGLVEEKNYVKENTDNNIFIKDPNRKPTIKKNEKDNIFIKDSNKKTH